MEKQKKKLNEDVDGCHLFQDEPPSSGDSGDESGSEPESPSEKLVHQNHKQEWTEPAERDTSNR
jgi:hypothetical protein